MCCSEVHRVVSGGRRGHCIPNVYTRVELLGWLVNIPLWSQGDLGKVLGLPLTHTDRLVDIVQIK